MFFHSHVSQLSRYLSSNRNMPEEDDETMSTEQKDSTVLKPDSNADSDGCRPPPEHTAISDDSLCSRHVLHREQEYKHNATLPLPGLGYGSYQPHHSFIPGYGQPTPFPSQAEGPWLHPSFASSWSGYANSLPSSLSEKDFSSCSGESSYSRYKFLSLPASHSSSMSSLEQPLSLRSNPPSVNLCHHTLSPYSCSPQGAPCCAQCPADSFSRGPVANKHPWPQYHPALSQYCEFSSVISLKRTHV